MRRAVPSIVIVGLAILLHLAVPARGSAAALFTDDPLIATRSIKAVHVTELRALINALRVQFGLQPFQFADTNLAGAMIKAQHMIELRSALLQAYDAAGRTPLPFTDFPIVPHQTAIKAVHITELRAAILALDTFAFGTIDLGTYPMNQMWAQLTGNFTWAVQPGSTLPPGTSLRTDTPSWFQPDAHAGIIGVPTAPGTYEFTLLRSGVPQAYRVRVFALNFKDYFQAPDAFVGHPFSYQLTALNTIGAVTWSPNPPSSLPPGMTLSPSGLLSGTPTAPGNYTINFSVTDSAGQGAGSGIRMNIYAVDITTNGSLPNATQGVPYSTTIVASGGSGGYTFTANNLPFGLTLNFTTGVISGTTTVNPTHWWFNVTATDSSNAQYSKTMSIEILSVPMTLPTVSPRNSSFETEFFDDCSLGSSCVNEAFVSGGGRAPFAWTATGLPPGMSARTGSGTTTSWIAPENLEVWGAPSQTGTFPVRLSVQDPDGRSATNTFDLHVSPLALTEYLQSGTVGTPYSIYQRVIGGRLPYTAAIVARRLPLGLTLDPNTLTVSGTPTEAGLFAPVLEFTDADGMKLRLTNYVSIGSGASTVFVNTGEDFGTITAGSFYSNFLNACCAPSGLTWSVTSGALPPGLTLSTGGTLAGTPTAGTSGTFTFVVKAQDSTNAANFGLRRITITVTPMSIASTNLPVGHVGSPYNGSIVVIGFTGTVTGTLEPFQYMPPGLTFHTDGTVDGTPTASGQYNFTARATDTAGHILIRSFTIRVYPANVNPPLDLNVGFPTVTAAIGRFSNGLQALEGTPPYTYSVTPGAPQVPGLRVQGPPLPGAPPGNGSFFGVLTTPGSYPTSIRAMDSIGGVIDRAMTINVSPLKILSQFNLPKATIGVPYTFTFRPFGGSSYSWSAQNLPPGITINPSTGTISGTPTTAGTFTPFLALTDAVVAGPSFDSFTLVVDPFAIVAGTNGVLPNGTSGVAYNQTLTTNPAGCGSTCSWSVVTAAFLPTGVTLSPSGVLSGSSGPYNASFTVQAAGSAGTVQKLVSLRIVNSPPIALTVNNGTAFGDTTIGNTVAFALNANGGTLPYTWSIAAGAVPAGITIQGPGETLSSGTGPGFMFLAGRPMQAGVFTFTVDVADSAGAHAQRQITWRVSELASLSNNLPLVGNPLVVNTPYTQPLAFWGGSGSFTFTALTPMPAGLTLNPATGVVSGTPTVVGFVNVSVKAVDNADSNKQLTQNITFTVSP